MQEGDVMRIAAHLLAEHGDKAIIVARERAKALSRLGNPEGAASWLAIVTAIEELSREQPRAGEALH
jgi:hypothetical protein